MARRRRCRLVNSKYKDIDLRQYSQIIIDTINTVVPGKNPQVFIDHFSTDPLTQGEAISLGRELSKIPELAKYGKTVTSFRLFDGRTDEASNDKSNDINMLKGGRMT